MATTSRCEVRMDSFCVLRIAEKLAAKSRSTSELTGIVATSVTTSSNCSIVYCFWCARRRVVRRGWKIGACEDALGAKEAPLTPRWWRDIPSGAASRRPLAFSRSSAASSPHPAGGTFSVGALGPRLCVRAVHHFSRAQPDHCSLSQIHATAEAGRARPVVDLP